MVNILDDRDQTEKSLDESFGSCLEGLREQFTAAPSKPMSVMDDIDIIIAHIDEILQAIVEDAMLSGDYTTSAGPEITSEDHQSDDVTPEDILESSLEDPVI